ncbi:MAG TPA: glutathione S-transferase family protein [Noviherbaspirillum sp.]
MKLIGLFDSPYVRRVAITMRLYGIDVEHVALSVFRDQDEMSKVNPMLKVPMLILDNGEKLVESSFILDYLDSEVLPDKRLTPASGPMRRQIQQQCATALLAVEKAVQIVYETKLRPDECCHVPWVERCTAQMHTGFGLMEEVPQSAALNGASLTQADVTRAVVYRFAQYALPKEFQPGRYPKLEALSAHCEGLPAFVQTPLE